MFGTKTDVPMNEVKKLYDEAAHRFAEGKEAPLVPVSLCFTARKDTGAVLSADGVSGRHAGGAGAEPPDHTGDDRKIAQKDRAARRFILRICVSRCRTV